MGFKENNPQKVSVSSWQGLRNFIATILATHFTSKTKNDMMSAMKKTVNELLCSPFENNWEIMKHRIQSIQMIERLKSNHIWDMAEEWSNKTDIVS